MADFLMVVGQRRQGKSALGLRLAADMNEQMAGPVPITHPWFRFWFPAGRDDRPRMTVDMASFLEESRRRSLSTYLRSVVHDEPCFCPWHRPGGILAGSPQQTGEADQ